MPSRKILLSNTLALALLSASAAFAGDVIIQKFNPATGELSSWAQGSTDHAPMQLLERGEPWLLDSCGQVFGFSEGTFGDMSLEGPLTPVYSLRDASHLAVNDYSGVAITGEGKLVKLILDGATRTRMGEANFDWIEDPESTIPAGDATILVHTRAGAGTYLFGKSGDLMKIEAFGEGRDRGRYLGARGSWKDVTHAIVAELLMGPNNLQQVLVTAHQDGSIKRHIITSNGGDYSLDSATLDGSFANTAALMPGSGFNQSHVLRLTSGGDLMRLDVSKGTEERLGNAGAFANGIVHVGKSTGYLVSSTGEFSTSCPEKPVVEEVVDPHADFDFEAVVDDFRATNRKKDEFSMAIDERIEITPPNDLLGKSEADIDAAMNAFVAEMTAFENEVLNPAIQLMEAHRQKYASYGEHAALNELVREKSGRKYGVDNPVPDIENDVAAYNEYKASLGDFVVDQARIQFAMAEYQNDPKEVAKSYMEAVPIAKWALKLDPENEEAKGYMAKAAGLAGSAISAEKAAIAKAKWPEDTEHCECDLDEFKARALYYFQRNTEKDGYKDGTRVVAVRIRSAMKPGETNILGEILNWHVRGWIALTNPEEPWFLTVRPVEFDTETNDRGSRFSGYHVDGDEYQIPLERVAIDDEDALEESLAIIEETTGSTPDDMPEDALDPSVTGIPGADGGAGGPSGGAGGGDGANGGSSGTSSGGTDAAMPDTNVEKSIENLREEAAAMDTSPSSTAEAAGSAAGGIFGWLLVIGLGGAAVWAARRWRGKIAEQIANHVSPEKRAAFNEKMRAAQESLKEKSAKAAEKAREAGAVAAKKAREAGESAADKAREASEQARRKAEDLRKQ